ncbi:DNA cytosine methyltransferase [Rubinisphaera sp.]|uniref:DNA cytosine methyltransferase n=1 Tax=Rubinisphaera sp. TaxID=2024857 RepID=UPI000C118BC7|nr:DNA cytosine methyltransferase [Rubinisphaera sp.]MBV12393.1 DNA (cytosine-5-)-methyltransferase [Rubinisphaera sp.]HCS50108.1 DNA (cytosine-5-)-methyltransferase [Planctomycetaceae bacterium]|tara:strand:- start:4365 stop:5324 length:960 start_codon:yes stop_codon:yes gene_type:complete
MKIISTFSGCGGSSLGYMQAGGKVLLAVEYDDHAAACYRANFPDTPLYHGDISKLNGDEALQLSGLKVGELDILDGSPPCQGFSTAGKRIFHDTRNQLFHEFVRLLRHLKPKTFVMENVAGLVKGKMKLIFVEIMRELKASGYQVKARLLNTACYGVPQARKRLIFIGVRDDLNIEPSHPKPRGPVVTIMEAIKGADTSGTPSLSKRYADIYHLIPCGGNAGDAWGIKSHFSDCVRPRPNKPCCTLPKMQTGTGFATICHPHEPRSLSIGEAKRIQTFPDGFILLGKFVDQWARIGNSVPPLFMKQIASHVHTTALGGK